MADQPATKPVLQKFFSIFVFAVGEEGKSFLLFALSCIYRVTLPAIRTWMRTQCPTLFIRTTVWSVCIYHWLQGCCWGYGGCWWSELESLSGCDIQQQTVGLRGPEEGVLRCHWEHRGREPVDKEVGLAVSSRWGLLIFSDSLSEPEFQGSCGLGSTGVWKLELLGH